MVKENAKELMSVHQIWKSKMIYWVTTYKTLLKYVSSDYQEIFKPVTRGKRSGKRYYVKKENLKKFVEMFENNELAE